MSIHYLAEIPWTDLRDLDPERWIAILPLGAVEAHGPHLPTSTDGIISAAMAEEGARLLAEDDFSCLLLPPLDYTAATFAAGFPGTVSIRRETETALICDIGAAVESWGLKTLVLINSHFDPAHLGAVYTAVTRLRAETSLRIVFPDVTRKPWALRLTDEFKSGACHAGCYEGSIVLARRPDLVRESRQDLPALPISLSTAIREGKSTFEEIGGSDAYVGDPAAATASEGEQTIAVLGRIVYEAVLESSPS